MIHQVLLIHPNLEAQNVPGDRQNQTAGALIPIPAILGEPRPNKAVPWSASSTARPFRGGLKDPCNHERRLPVVVVEGNSTFPTIVEVMAARQKGTVLARVYSSAEERRVKEPRQLW